MRHIEPVLQVPDSCMYRRIKDATSIDPRQESCLWDAEPTGKEFTYGTLDITRVVTQHTSSIFFKPSLAEVYAWIRVFFHDRWQEVDCFCLGEATRISQSTDFICQCDVMGGQVMVKGGDVTFANGEIGYRLVPQESA